MIILGGRGTGYSAGVNHENRLMVEGVSSSIEHHVNHHGAVAFNALFVVTTDAAADMCFFYLKNSAEKDLVIEGMTLSIDKATNITVELGNIGDPDSGTAITPVNLHVGSGNVAEGTFEYGDDLGNAGATLTGGAVCERFAFTAARQSSYINFEQDIIVRKNAVVTMWTSAATTTVTGTVIFNYHNAELAD